MSRAVRVVMIKELVDNLRDRRSLRTALLMPLLGPVLAGVMIVVMGTLATKRTDETLELPVVGAEHAPNLIAFLKQNNVDVRPAPLDPLVAVKTGEYELVLVVPAEFGESLRASRPATLTLVVDESRTSAAPSIGRARGLIRNWGARVGALRLLDRGVAPTVATPVALEIIDVGELEGLAAAVVGILPYFILFAVFMGGFYVAIDTTAGELERGSLEALVINPVKRWQLVVGKLGATWAFCVGGLVLTVLGFVLLPHFISTDELGVPLRLEPGVLLRIFLVFLPLTALAASTQMIVATFSKSFKEAQSQVQVLLLVLVLPGAFLAMMPFRPHAWMMLVPTLSEQLLAHMLLRGEPVSILFGVLSTVSTLGFALLGCLIAVKLFSAERVLARLD